MTIHRPSLAAFCRDVVHAAGVLITAATVADYAAENKRLRAANRDLLLENAVLRGESTGLAEIADDQARELAMLKHSSARGLQADVLCAEFAREIDYRLAEVAEEWTL